MEEMECYSTNGEDFIHQDFGDVLDYLDCSGELEVGREYQRGVAYRNPLSHYADIELFFENMGEQAYDAAGEYAEGFPDLTK
jgi:hypothetical protein